MQVNIYVGNFETNAFDKFEQQQIASQIVCFSQGHVAKHSSNPSMIMKQEQQEQQVCKHPDDNEEQTAGLRPNPFRQMCSCLVPSARQTDAAEAAAATQLDPGGM